MGKREHESTTFYLALTLLGEDQRPCLQPWLKAPAVFSKKRRWKRVLNASTC